MVWKEVIVVSFNRFAFIMSFIRFFRIKFLILWSCDKLKTLYFDCQKIYRHQTWKGGDIEQIGCTHKATWPFQLVTSRSHVGSLIYISTITMSMVTWHCGEYNETLPPIKSHGLWNTWLSEVTWQTKNTNCPLAQCIFDKA